MEEKMHLLGKHEHSDEALAGWRKLAEAGGQTSVSLPRDGTFGPQIQMEIHTMRGKDAPERQTPPTRRG